MSRIRWSNDECQILAQRVLEIQAVAPHLSVVDAVKQAQIEKLLPNRRRKIQGKHMISKYVLSLLRLLQQQSHPLPEPKILPLPPPPSFDKQLEEFFVRVLVGATQRLAEDPLIQKLFQGNVDQAVGVIAAVDAANRPHKHNPEMEYNPTDRKPLILFVGLKPHQRAVFESTYHDFALKFWYDESVDRLKEKAKSADRIIVMKEAASHSSVEAIISVGKGDQLIRVPGATSTLLEVMNELRRQKNIGQL